MEKVEYLNKHLSAEERATIILMRQEKRGLREIGRFLKRTPSTILRETGRDLASESGHVASLAGEQARGLRTEPRKALKLVVGRVLFDVVVDHFKKKWSPGQIAGTLKAMYPDSPSQRVSIDGGVSQDA